ncbi:MAG: EndoU domain-containing protein [Alphaproteobacteria bacterium]|nr:EndoU domain-containing protein [Alphaproteobacteria bacterium]
MQINWLSKAPVRLFTAILLTLITLWLLTEALHPTQSSKALLQNKPDPVLTRQGAKHLLYGDTRGGGHLHGSNRPCKSEFPADWDAQEVITTVKQVAANDNLNWKQQDNGYHVSESMVENIRVRVVLNQDQTKIITAYPTNVPRNPCPERQDAANDN